MQLYIILFCCSAMGRKFVMHNLSLPMPPAQIDTHLVVKVYFQSQYSEVGNLKGDFDPIFDISLNLQTGT